MTNIHEIDQETYHCIYTRKVIQGNHCPDCNRTDCATTTE